MEDTTHEAQSTYIKYVSFGHIDLIDTIITILSNEPGADFDRIFACIYPPDAKGYIAKVRDQVNNLVEKKEIIESEGLFYLHDDAWSHDISKTMDIMNKVTALGVSPSQVTFLSSGMVMAAEKARTESEGRTYNPMETIANSAVGEPDDENPIVINKVYGKQSTEVSEDNDDVPTPNFEDFTPEELASFSKPEVVDEVTEPINEDKEEHKETGFFKSIGLDIKRLFGN